MSKSLARELIDSALAADLTQNELRVFIALFRQTICYGKASDPLTLKRLAALTRIRKDRLSPAIASVLGKGIFDAVEHPVFEFEYRIPAALLAECHDSLYAPSLPENGGGSRFRGEVSEKRVHTYINLTANNLTTTASTPPPAGEAGVRRGRDDENSQQDLPYPATFGKQGRKSAARILDGLNPDDARDCLLLLNLGMAGSKVKSPLGYLHQLAQAARNGGLDRGPLRERQQADRQQEDTSRQERLRSLAADIQGIDALFARAGIPMDDASAATRAAWVAEYNAIRLEVQP